MHIAMLTMDDSGGLFQYTTQLANALTAHVDVTVVVPESADEGLFDDAVRVSRLPVGDDLRNAVRNTVRVTPLARFLRVLRGAEFDLFHFQNCYNAWAASFLPFLRNRPVLTTFHDVDPHLGFDRLDKRVARRLHLRYSDAVFVQCERERDNLRDLDASLPAFVVPHGEYSFFTDFERDGVAEADEILFFGNIEPYKGLRYLLEAAPTIEQQTDASIVVAGDGDIEPYAELLDSLDRVEVRNYFVPNEEVAELFARAKVVVLPYVDATQSGVIPIAYAFETPVVATSVGCLPEVVEDGETGLLVPPRSVEPLADAVVRLLDDDETRRSMGANARHKMEHDLSWGAIAEQTVEAYEQTLDVT